MNDELMSRGKSAFDPAALSTATSGRIATIVAVIDKGY
jgi:hypothetical protein